MDVDDSSKQPSRAVHLPALSTVGQQIHDVSIVIEAEKTMEGVELSNIPWKLHYSGKMAQHHKSGSFPPWNFLDLRQTQNTQWAMNQLTEGIRLAKAGCAKEAEACYKNGLDMDPGNADILVAYGALCANLGRMTEGITKLEKATQVDPQSRNAQSYLDAIRRRQLETPQQRKIPSLATRSDEALQDAILEKSFLTGAPNDTKVKNTSHCPYPFVYEETKQESDDDLSTEYRKRIRRKRKEKHKKRSKRKSKHSYDSDIDDNCSESARRESKRRKKKRKRRRESPTSSDTEEVRQRKGLHHLSSNRDGQPPKGRENGTHQTIPEGDTMHES
jgi:tetratricopeptide (TPR) repeat protein